MKYFEFLNYKNSFQGLLRTKIYCAQSAFSSFSLAVKGGEPFSHLHPCIYITIYIFASSGVHTGKWRNLQQYVGSIVSSKVHTGKREEPSVVRRQYCLKRGAHREPVERGGGGLNCICMHEKKEPCYSEFSGVWQVERNRQKKNMFLKTIPNFIIITNSCPPVFSFI